MESFSSTYPSGSRFLRASFVRVPCTSSTHGRVVGLAARRVDVAVDTCTSPCPCFRLPFRTSVNSFGWVGSKPWTKPRCQRRRRREERMRIFLGNGRGKGGEVTSVHPVEPGRLEQGGIQRRSKRQAMGDSHVRWKGTSTPPNRRKGIYLPPLLPTRQGGASSTASDEMLRSRPDEIPEIGRRMRRCTHRSTSRDVRGMTP